MRGELKKALIPDAGSHAASVPAERALTETERQAALKQAQGELKRKYGHLVDLDPRILQETVQLAQRVNDPTQRVGFLAKLIGELMQDPAQAAALKTALGSHFAPAPVVAAPTAEPQYLVRGQDGQTYIDPDKFAEWQQWREDRLRDGFQDQLKPLQQVAEELRTQKEAVELDRKVGEFTTSVHGYIKSLPDYETNRPAIAAAFNEDVTALLARNPTASPAEIENCAIKAYNRVTAPKAAQSAEARVQATLKAKAEGRTASPNGNQRSSVAVKERPEGERLRAALKKELFPDSP